MKEEWLTAPEYARVRRDQKAAIFEDIHCHNILQMLESPFNGQFLVLLWHIKIGPELDRP